MGIRANTRCVRCCILTRCLHCSSDGVLANGVKVRTGLARRSRIEVCVVCVFIPPCAIAWDIIVLARPPTIRLQSQRRKGGLALILGFELLCVRTITGPLRTLRIAYAG